MMPSPMVLITLFVQVLSRLRRFPIQRAAWLAMTLAVAAGCRDSARAPATTVAVHMPSPTSATVLPIVGETPEAPYPGWTPETAVATITPKPTSAPAEPTMTATPQAPSISLEQESIYLPLIGLPAPEMPPIVPVVVAADFASVREQLQSAGQDLAFAKIGFHVTLLQDEDLALLMEQVRLLDEAGVPVFLKSVNNAEPLFLAQQVAKASDVPHTLVYRSAAWDVPEYHLSPELAAERHWQRHRDTFPPELDPSLVWIETVNEVDKNVSEWLAQFALKTAELTMRDGFRWAAFGWATGEPEPEHWRLPTMLQFLRLAGENPDRLAIALHEYSLETDNIAHIYPFKVGRFLDLFRAADQNGFPRPTVLITEWGWTHIGVPPADQAMQDIRWAAALYAPFPQVKGAAIWNFGLLGCCDDDLSILVKPLVEPLAEYSLRHYFVMPVAPGIASTDPNLYRR